MTQPLQIIEAKTVADGDRWHVYLADASGRKVAALWGSQDEKMKNARLFAAAGEMLEALVAVQQWLDTRNDKITNFPKDDIDAAVLRARGVNEA